MWSLRILVSKLRPLDLRGIVRLTIVAALFAGFLYGDFALFRRLFAAIGQVEVATPFFAIGLLRNLLSMVFLVATTVLFSSSLTAAIGAFFSDLDLDIYHAAPRPKLQIALARWLKTLTQSAAIVFTFLIPLFVAFALRYHIGPSFYVVAGLQMLLLLSIPVSLASTAILLLVRFFPVQRVHQIVATLAMIVLTVAVIGFRMSRPERFFAEVRTDDVVRVLKSVELPSMDAFPSTALADWMTAHTGSSRGTTAGDVAVRLGFPAAACFALFLAVARRWYFAAFVRARESMAPVALGSATATRTIDAALRRFDVQTRALVAKEVRVLARDAAQWSQLFLMVALLFIYLYNIRILPLGGDARATLVAYANLGMTGFIVSAICLRFAYPSISSEGRAFWLVRAAPIDYRRVLLVKVAVYSAPLTVVSLLLTGLANAVLGASTTVWLFTMIGAALLAVTLVSMGVGMGSFSPDFGAENPLQVGLSLGGFAYMALSLAYVATIMLLMARPVIRFFFRRIFGTGDGSAAISAAAPVVIAITLSAVLMVFPLLIAERKLAQRD